MEPKPSEPLDRPDPARRLTCLPGSLAVCRLPPDAALPPWALDGELTSVTRTEEELSIVCSWEGKPPAVRAEGPFRALKVLGPLDFSLVGILASLTLPLARGKVPVFAVSTFDTDYLLVPEYRLGEAVSLLREAGLEVATKAYPETSESPTPPGRDSGVS